MADSTDEDWVSRFADSVIAESERRVPGKPVVVASGLSPSGPIHLGNLREVMTPHLVADEIRRRGHRVRHLISWDDYDRFRKVPAGVAGINESWTEHIGKPLTRVPAPKRSPYPNWAEHFKGQMIGALGELGMEYDEISQTERYTSGAYREQILHAMRRRADIDAILAPYRTLANQAPTGEYFPYRPYCMVCGRDTTIINAYDDETTELTYTCICGFGERVWLSEFNRGKLVWKVDWPMRWAYEGVVFEPSGVDHSSPGSSFQVGGQIVGPIFGGEQPIGPMYAFVGISGMAKMSSSKGGVPTPGDAMDVMEPQILRWLYARRRPNQSFKIAFDQEIPRIYDEWDTLARKGGDDPAYRRAAGTAAGDLPRTPRPLPFRTLASIADITSGNEAQMLRILAELYPDNPVRTLDEVQPRLDRAVHWTATQVPVEDRTVLLTAPNTERLTRLSYDEWNAIDSLLTGLDSHWSLEGLTKLVYAVPKALAGLSPDTKPTPELKAAQRAFFVLLYELLVGRDTGPRLPTLLLAIGKDRVRELLRA